MGVDTSVSAGVGFVIDPEIWDAYVSVADPEREFDTEDLLDYLLKGTKGLGYVTGGSYYDDSPMSFIVCVKRLTVTEDTGYLPGGVITIDHEALTANEIVELIWVAVKLGQAPVKTVNFMSVLWH